MAAVHRHGRDLGLPDPDRAGLEHGVARQDHAHLVAGGDQGAGQSGDHVREPAGLGEGRVLGGDHQDAHGAPPGTGPDR